MKNTKVVQWLVFAGALLVCTIGLARQEILMIDTRFALFVHEMSENGIYPFPQLYGKFYPDYTSIPVILMYWSSLIFGKINWLTIVLPSAIAMAFIVMFVYKIGCRMYSHYHGLIAALLMFSSWEILNIGRIVSLDAYPALAAIVGFYLLYTADEDKKYLRLWWLPVLMILGFLARGPIGVIVPTAVFVAYCLIAGRFLRLFILGASGAVILAGLLALWAWFSYRCGGDAFYKEFWYMQIGNRLSNVKPPWYYFADALGSYAITYPLGMAVLGTYIYCFRKKMFLLRQEPKIQKIQLLAVWMLIILVGMSVPGTKHLRYVTGAIPAAALLAALLFSNPDRLKFLTWLRRWAIRLFCAVPFFALIGLWIGAWILRMPEVIEKLDGVEISLPLMVPSMVLGVFCLAVICLRKGIKRRDRNLMIVVIMVFTVVLARIMMVEPIAQFTMTSDKFVDEVETLRPDGQPLYFIFLGPDGDENKYMLHVERKRIFVPKYLNEGQPDLKSLPAGTLIVSREDRWLKRVGEDDRNRAEVLAKGRIGRRDCVLLRVTGEPKP